MGNALEVVAGRALNPGAALTALTPNTGNSFQTRSFPFESGAYIDGLWVQSASAGIVRVRSPRMHDFVQGIRYRTIAGLTRNFLPDQVRQRLYPQDTLTFEIAGGGAETDSAAMLFYYNDLPGIQAVLKMWEEIKPRIQNILTQEVAVAGPTTAGDWSAGTALNTTFDTLKPNTEYAVLGYQTDTASLAVAVSSSRTGNLRVGGPGTTETIETRDWFVSLSLGLGAPCIPVINSAERAATLVSVCRNTAAGTDNVGLTLAELSA